VATTTNRCDLSTTRNHLVVVLVAYQQGGDVVCAQRVNIAGIKEMLKGQEAESDKKKKKCAVQ
jgi:hypothetical protein